MKIYVATKWEEADRAKELVALLEQDGHTITYKWWMAEQFSQAQAIRDRDAVCAADVLVFIAEKDLPYKGTYVEMGIAIGRRIPVFVLGHAADACIFTKLPEVHSCINLDALRDYLAQTRALDA